MVTVATECRDRDGVTLVECRLTNPGAAPIQVRLESRLDGPTWPPRDGEHPDRGWCDGAWTGRLDADTTVGVGFASPAPPANPPVNVEELGPAGDPNDRTGVEPTPADVARSLPDPRPPRDGLVGIDESAERPTDEPAVERPTDPGRTTSETTAWLDEVTDRVERLEALSAARTLPDATVAVADAGGLGGVCELRATTREDRDRLLTLAARAERLAGRIEAADVPVETLERLA